MSDAKREQPDAFLPNEPRIDAAMAIDRPELRRLQKSIRHAQRQGRPFNRNADRFAWLLQESAERRARRASNPVPVTYPEDLPIAEKRDEVAALVREHQVVVVCGETGSGKSTQLPKILLELGYGVDGVIGHTQPRRIAARALASRVADELSVPLGNEVGYAVRFNDVSGPDTRMRYLTDGLLLAELGNDPDLLRYDALIVDEAHERSLNIDFLLGYLKRLLPRRPELKLILTSATIDPQRFAAFFSAETQGETTPAPIIEVSGRTYPVEVRYRPPNEGVDVTAGGPGLDHAVCDALDELAGVTDGDVLVFMPTERAIGQCAKAIRGHVQSSPVWTRGKAVEVLPLYARLSSAEQQRVFNPKSRGGTRRIVIATNVAESSVTVPNVMAVIDPGTARMSRYSARTRMQRLPIEVVSQASANQRAGRCGRVGPGTCIRLCSEESFAEREAFTTPEVLRTSLAAVILRMAALRLGDIEDFPFLEPPRPAAIREGVQTLRELGAIERDGRLTKIGRQLARLPIDPRVGRMVLAGETQGCLPEMLVIASALEGQDPRLRPPDQQQAADEAQAEFRHDASDFLGYLKLWDAVHEQKRRLSGGHFRKWCTKKFLSYPRLREWFDLHRQLGDLARESKLKVGKRVGGDDGIEKIADGVHRALLAGLLSNIATKTDASEYTGAHGTKLRLWPGSTLSKARPRWVVSAEIVATSQTFARTVAAVQPQWIEPVAGELVKRTHREPHWLRDRGYVAAYEKATLFGLVITPKRRIRYAAVEPAKAREIFIHEALVNEDADLGSSKAAAFFRNNVELRERVEKVQAKQRRYDLLADQQARFDFYDRRLPAEVCGIAELNRFLKSLPESERGLLFMRESDLLVGEAEDDAGRPDALEVAGMKLPLAYKFDAGAEDDGVTLRVPLNVLGRVSPSLVDWGVPGTLVERITALIRSLPKPIRKALVPAPQSAAEAASRVAFGQGDFLEAVAEALGHIAGQKLDPGWFDPAAIERHHRLNVAVVDDAGQPIAQGRDVAELQAQLGEQAGHAAADFSGPDWRIDGLRQWADLGDKQDLPERVEVTHDGFALVAYPALIVADDGTVQLRALESPERAQREHARGVLRLIALQDAARTRQVVRAWPGMSQLALAYSAFGASERLVDDLAAAARDRAFGVKVADYPPRSAGAFEALLAAGRGDVPDAVDTLCDAANQILAEAQPLRLELERLKAACPPGWDAAVGQCEEQLRRLVAPGFVRETPAEWLPHVPRYLAGSRLRLRKLGEGKADRDRQLAAQFEQRWNEVRRVWSTLDEGPELLRYRWLLEEYRVSLFAQELGTAVPVSDKRLDKQRKKAQRRCG